MSREYFANLSGRGRRGRRERLEPWDSGYVARDDREHRSLNTFARAIASDAFRLARVRGKAARR